MAELPAVGRQPADEIRRAFLERRAVLFCGAGISIEPPATLPDWKTLRDETIRAVAGSDEALVDTLPTLLRQNVDGGIGASLAPELVATIVRGVVPDYFQSLRVLDHDQPNRNHTLIARLAGAGLLRCVLSTNFDQLIETAFLREGVDLQVLRSDNDFAAFKLDAAEAGPTVLFKLHGCISDPDTIVATVEQEAVGLSPQKAAVLRSIWNALSALFWGYSGADLKLDVDYLKQLTTAATAKGFFWNLHATREYRSEPNEFVLQLVSALDGRGVVCHEPLVDILGSLVDVTPSAPATTEDAGALRRERSEALIAALAAWARQSVRPAHAYEVIARLHNSIGDDVRALECFQRLADYGREKRSVAIGVSGLVRCAELLARAGQWERVYTVWEDADQGARTVGALEIDLLCARIFAQARTGGGRVLSSIQPRAFARLLAQWTPTVSPDVLAIDLDTAEELAKQRLFDSAVELCQAAEDDARRAGRLVQVAEALAQRSRVHELQGDTAAAITHLREGSRLFSVLGMRTEAVLLQFRTNLLEVASGGRPDVDELNRSLADIWPLWESGRNERIACEQLLALLESSDAEAEDGLAWTDRVGKYVFERGGHHLAVRLAVQRSRFLSAAGRTEEVRSVIEEVLPHLTRVGNEAAAQDLLSQLAVIAQSEGRGDEEVLRLVEQTVSASRRTFGAAIASEKALARLRLKTGRVSTLPSVAGFLEAWQTHLPDLPHLLARFAPAAGVSQPDELARSLEVQVGAEAACAWLMWSTAVLCRQLREADAFAGALAIAAGTQPMALALGDHQFSAILHNECGLNLLLMKHPDQAHERFTNAIADATAGADLAELVDNHVNAADACEAMGRLEEAVEHLTRARQYVEARQDLATAATVALRLGELFKALKRDRDAIQEFKSAEYFTRTLGWSEKVEQVVLRLGKLYWNVGEFEVSIRYRDELVTIYEARSEPETAALFAHLVAGTYDEKLARPADAARYFRRALALNDAGQLDAADLQSRLDRCEAQARDTLGGLWDTLLECEASQDSAEQTAARLAMAIDFDLWGFEPRSFCAWYERVFAGAVSYPAQGDGELPIWPFAAVYQLVELSISARELHRHDESLRYACTADRLAESLGIAQGRFLAAHASAATCAELGRTDLETQHLTRAQTIKREFDAAAAARGLEARKFGDKIVDPWNLIGLLLTLQARDIPDINTRHTVVKGRFVDEFFMNLTLGRSASYSD